MTRQQITLCRLLVLATLGVGAPASAQPTDRTAGYAGIGKACAAETKRLCTALDPAVVQPRSQAICLRPYRSSLSSGCRRAIDATRR